MRKLTSEANPAPTWLTTIRGSVHVSASDFVILYPHVCSFFLKTTVNPRRGIDLHINMALEFLKLIQPELTAHIAHAFPNENLLTGQATTLEQIPTNQKHKPKNEKYTAARLRIDHEWMWRLLPRVDKRLRTKKAEEHDQDRDGRFPADASEVWVHNKPDQDEIQKFLDRDVEAEKKEMEKEKEVTGTHRNGSDADAVAGAEDLEGDPVKRGEDDADTKTSGTEDSDKTKDDGENGQRRLDAVDKAQEDDQQQQQQQEQLPRVKMNGGDARQQSYIKRRRDWASSG